MKAKELTLYTEIIKAVVDVVLPFTFPCSAGKSYKKSKITRMKKENYFHSHEEAVDRCLQLHCKDLMYERPSSGYSLAQTLIEKLPLHPNKTSKDLSWSC